MGCQLLKRCLTIFYNCNCLIGIKSRYTINLRHLQNNSVIGGFFSIPERAAEQNNFQHTVRSYRERQKDVNIYHRRIAVIKKLNSWSRWERSICNWNTKFYSNIVPKKTFCMKWKLIQDFTQSVETPRNLSHSRGIFLSCRDTIQRRSGIYTTPCLEETDCVLPKSL